jgi:hypothetical protein
VVVGVEGNLHVVQTPPPLALAAEAVRAAGVHEAREDRGEAREEFEVVEQVVALAPQRAETAQGGDEKGRYAAAQLEHDAAVDLREQGEDLAILAQRHEIDAGLRVALAQAQEQR